MSKGLVRLAIGALLLVYPVLVWFGLDRFGPALMALVLGLLLAARLVIVRTRLGRALPPLLVALAVFVALAAFSGDDRVLRFYPVLINSGLALLCGWSLLRPPSLLERMLRLAKREVPATAPPYLRAVTATWAVFFMLNAAVVAWTALAAPLSTWVFYNGFLAYLLIAALVVLEWLVRPFYRRWAEGRTDNA